MIIYSEKLSSKDREEDSINERVEEEWIEEKNLDWESNDF